MADKLEKVIVVKIGGSTLGEHDTTIEDIVRLQQEGRSLVVVHGGGGVVTSWLKNLGIETRFIRGQRVTDRATLEVVVAVLGGLVNKEIVASINSTGGRAVGITGIDGAFIRGRIGDAGMGYVGVAEKVDLGLVRALLTAGFIPVVAPLALYLPEAPEETTLMLNMNGDTVAGEIAAAVGAESLIFLTDVAGIRDESGKVLPRLSAEEAEALLASGVASGGMIPKVEAALRALYSTAETHIMDGRRRHALYDKIAGRDGGTTIVADK